MRWPHPKERLLRRIEYDTNGGCWLWAGRSASNGYGSLRFGKRYERAHRAAWALWFGAIPSGLWVLHRCDVRVCVNPDHLFLGTHADNMADMAAKGRAPKSRARLTMDAARDIRRLCETVPQRDVAKVFGVSRPQVSRIVSGLQWKERARA